MTQDGKPTFVGSQQEIELAGQVFDLMLLQGRFFSGDAPIRQSLPQLSTYFQEQGRPVSANDLDNVLQKNPQVFHREEHDGVVYYVTTKKGSYTPPIHTRAGALPSITQRHISGYTVPRPPAPPVKKPTIISHDNSQLNDLQQLLKASHAQPLAPFAPVAPILKEQPAPVAPKEPRQPRTSATAPAPAKRVPQVETPQGLVINLSKSPAEILAKHRDFFTATVREKLSADERFVSFGTQWMLADQLVTLAKGELRQVREFIETSGGPEADDSLCSNIFQKSPQSDPAFRFSLNYHLAAEKRVFEFVGTQNQNLWWLTGSASPRIVRSPLKPAEIGQDLKYLEDEPPVAKLTDKKWAHALTFYEAENGILPYSPEAKLLLPPPLFKEQKLAQLRFEVPQFEISAYVELHYPTGNRGGWIEGLGELLASFISGVRLFIARDPDKIDTFLMTFEVAPVQEQTVLIYDGRRQRFVFQALRVGYQTDEAYLIDRQRFAGLKDARRLDEANRRKGDAAIIFAFEKIGAKVTREDKTVYRARLEDLLPIINIEKPFSRNSLLRFFITHPHYQKDETEEGYYLYLPDKPEEQAPAAE